MQWIIKRSWGLISLNVFVSGLNKHYCKALKDVDAQKTTLNAFEINYFGFLLKYQL